MMVLLHFAILKYSFKTILFSSFLTIKTCQFQFIHKFTRIDVIIKNRMLTMFNIHTSTAGTLTMYRNSVNLRHFYKHVIKHLRDRPFNLQGGHAFLLRSEICFRTSRVRKKKIVALSANFFSRIKH